MEHYGDIRKLNGAELPPVDIITFGSPCQDLSNAGKREGLSGSRSGLFYEAIRIIKEMREKTNGKYPKYIVWENVSGARSSNKGKDFKEVLRQICSIKEADVSIPEPEKGKWLQAGEIMGDSFSLAWRTLDAKYWGVPQRRERIFIVADFTTPPHAGKILFESEGLSGYSAQDFRAWQAHSRSPEAGLDSAGSMTLYENHSQDSRYNGPLEVAQTVSATYGTGGNNQPLVVEDPVYLMTNAQHNDISRDLAYALSARDYKDPPLINDHKRVRRLTPIECARLQGFPDNWCADLATENPDERELAFWRNVFESIGKKKTDNQIKRWLKNPHSDAAEYRLWGNGVALPCVWFVMAGIEYVERNKEGEK